MSFIPGNGVYVVQGEMSILLTAMRRGARWSSHSHLDEENDILIKGFSALKDVLNSVGDLRAIDPLHFLEPFLEVIKSEETTGPVTSLALSSVSKFLSYGLIDPGGKSVPAAVERIADAVTHARFVGTDQASDGVVLMKILQVLRSLVLSPLGVMLTNDSVCEIMLSCLRICFEVRLSELLRRCAEHYLKDMVQLLFTRLPYFSEDLRKPINMKKLKMRSGSIDQSRGKRKLKSSMRKTSRPQIKTEDKEKPSHIQLSADNFPQDKVSTSLPLATTPVEFEGSKEAEVKLENETPTVQTPISDENANETETVSGETEIVEQPQNEESQINGELQSNVEVVPDSEDPQCKDGGAALALTEQTELHTEEQPEDISSETHVAPEDKVDTLQIETPVVEPPAVEPPKSPVESAPQSPTSPSSDTHEWYNSQGVRFTPQEEGPLVPYGVLCVRELFRFLVSLCNPLNKENSEVIIHTGLTLLTVALEVGADAIGKYATLLTIVKDDLCRNLFMLLNSERLSIFAANLQVSFLLFESLRTHLKFQLELFLSRLSEIIVSDNSKISFEQKELALECVVQLWRIPGLVTELYLNYDCDLYCPNVYEDLTKLLSKNAFPVTGVYSTHLLSLDALLTIIDTIEHHCNSRILNEKQVDSRRSPVSDGTINIVTPSCVMVSRQKVSQNIPSHEQLMAIKRKKKLLATGTEHFNVKPKKGIQFLQEHHILSGGLEPQEVVQFLKENPHLDKKMIGEYISSRNNLAVLDAFVKSFDFTDLRIDEALRLYLETFRLPGESPLISLLMEHFAEHWHKCNGEPFANADAAFTLAYAVIMLNVDQHNHNVKRQNNPMTADEFKRNLKKVNGGQDFDQDLLDDIYIAIKNEEIVMPAEQTGLVRDNYLWKVLLRRGEGKDGVYIHAPNGLLDHDLFSLIWGPTVAALSFMFDKSHDPAIYQKAISGFRKCAMISAHYGMSNDFDNLIVSLCKFTMLINSNESPDSLTISFGGNPKAMLAASTVFNLAHRHGDIIREGWKNVLDCILQLYRCKLLPKILVEAEDFIELSGKISLMREEIQLSQKAETGLLSSIYSYISLGSEMSSHRVPSPEDQDHIRQAQACIRDCHLEQLITESKFLRSDSLHELIKALIHASYGPEGHVSLGTSYNEDTAVFFLELLLKVVIQNRDRVSSIWQSVRDHIYTLLMGAAACDHHFLVERSVVGLLRLAIRLMRREDMSPVVLQSLRMLLLLKASTLARVARQVSYGLYELLKTSAANIHSATDWAIIFTLLECVGAGAPPPRVVGKPSHHETGAKSDGEVGLNPKFGIEEDSGLGNERGCTSDSELSLNQNIPSSPNTTSPELSPNTGGGWIMVGREGDIQPLNRPLSHMFSGGGERDLASHDPFSLVKCCESLAFLVRDVAHITPYNFENCVHCIRTFVEASLESSSKSRKTNKEAGGKQRRRVAGRKKEETRARSPTSAYDADESDSEEVPSGYHQVPIQLLDLMHTLHTRTAQIYRWWAEENAETELTSLWAQGWCPLLQGISRLCCDTRKQVRMSAITYLQRALLVHDLQTLNGDEWESCFNKVLFPLLSKLLEPMPNNDHSGLEETRMRAATLLSKVFLHHLTPLQSLPTFTALWMRILDYMDKYMHVDKSDLLYEAIPESLKNMLLVMDSAGVFSTADQSHSQLWSLTWDRINSFLPNLHQELIKSHPPPPSQDTQGGDLNKPASPDQLSNPPTPSVTQTPASASIPVPVPAPATPSVTVPRTDRVMGPPPAAPVSANRQNTSTTIFPHMGQLVSTPIGPPNPPHSSTSPVILPPSPLYPIPPMPCATPVPPVPPVPQASAEITDDQSSSLPVYDGFATIPSEPAIPPSAQFFYQDVVQPQGTAQSSSPPSSSGGGLLLENTVISSLPIISPPDS
ncbi:Golgi-specific brefeldin A-resistance guanine nucleotide exchange factor 1-like isoform X2 [Macrosteles quadrilineatus]|uniref:Golgi-specific brefeldin A-resistance guanine nucleotide exchange factor 1-like isoform X2 n=1 Tax=Macrosteles quadrilineatus TaxID=74068 RepID=UPI0023E1F9D6|nr:Golgi-specific brefeldin A-resistance guanine nucleotide exchange factor 1-like isoform X2 [Macrosteles quadrilineatus]